MCIKQVDIIITVTLTLCVYVVVVVCFFYATTWTNLVLGKPLWKNSKASKEQHQSSFLMEPKINNNK